MTPIIPDNLIRLHHGEETLRLKAIALLMSDDECQRHLVIVECVMDLADTLRQYETDDEDTKLIQVLGMRSFNAFASSVKLALSGYTQNSAIILRDVLETVFLLDLFRGDRTVIAEWRLADKQSRKRKFGPIHVRTKLDQRDGFIGLKRAAIYDMFSELASHATMQSIAMLRPLNMDAQIGPFIDRTAMTAVLSEMGRLAVQVGEQLYEFVPRDWHNGYESRLNFLTAKKDWLGTFYPESI